MTTFTIDTIPDSLNSLRDGEAGSEGGAPISIATTDMAQSKPHKSAVHRPSGINGESPGWVEYVYPRLPPASRWLMEGDTLVGIAIQRRRGKGSSKHVAVDRTSDKQPHVNTADSGCASFDGNEPEFAVGVANLTLAIESCNRFFAIGDEEPHYLFVLTADQSYLVAASEHAAVAVRIEAVVTRSGVCEYPTRATQGFKFLPREDIVRVASHEEDQVEQVGTRKRVVRTNYVTDQGAEHEAVVSPPRRRDWLPLLMATLGEDLAGDVVCCLQGRSRFTSAVEKVIRGERKIKICATRTAAYVAIAVGGLRIGWYRKPTLTELTEVQRS